MDEGLDLLLGRSDVGVVAGTDGVLLAGAGVDAIETLCCGNVELWVGKKRYNGGIWRSLVGEKAEYIGLTQRSRKA